MPSYYVGKKEHKYRQAGQRGTALPDASLLHKTQFQVHNSRKMIFWNGSPLPLHHYFEMLSLFVPSRLTKLLLSVTSQSWKTIGLIIGLFENFVWFYDAFKTYFILVFFVYNLFLLHNPNRYYKLFKIRNNLQKIGKNNKDLNFSLVEKFIFLQLLVKIEKNTVNRCPKNYNTKVSNRY